MATPDSVTALLEQTSWVQRLARRLVQDASMADDLAQDTLVRALEERPDAQRSLRGWLATVMRTSLGKRRRGEGNRTARERLRARDEAGPSTLDVVERAATHRDVVQAVLGLEEPYRSTILMRFFDQLSYGEIARRLRVTEATVNSRITRGLERLRQRLAAAYGGDRHALFLALAPLARTPAIPAAALPFTGVKLMNLALAATTLSVVAVTVSLGLKDPSDPGRRAEPLFSTIPVEFESSTPLAEPRREPLPATGDSVATPSGSEEIVQERRQKDRWETTVSSYPALPVTIEALAVSTEAGDVRLVPSGSAGLEITAKVTADTDRIDRAALTQRFEDHVAVLTRGSSMKIETAHKNESGWSVSFTVGVPRDLIVTANTGSGDVHVLIGGGKVTANTGSGDVHVALPDGRLSHLQANTGSGDVEIEALAVEERVSGNTGSGDVDVRLHDALSTGRVDLNSGSGDCTLTVPPAVVGSFGLSTGMGDIDVPPSLGLRVEDRGDGHRVKGTVGSGGGQYELSTGMGDLAIRLER